ERTSLFEEMADHYDTRNKIVHGASLEKKHLRIIQNDEPLRNIVRRLLVAFLHLAKSPQYSLDKQFYQQLDSILQHSRRRSELRKAMGLSQAES
ncbi:MAG: hypothetical protein ACRDGG_06725, partial [Anaerolineae bacterium]